MKKRDRRNLGIIIFFLSPCALASLLTFESFGWKQVLLVVVIAGWMLSAAYGLVRDRSLVEDVAPFVLVPVALVLLVWRIAGKILALVSWLAGAFNFMRGRTETVEAFDAGVPRDWWSLVGNERTMNKLLPGRKVVLGYNERRVVMSDLVDDRHLLITGETGYGKTTVGYSMLLSLLSIGPGIFDKMHFSIHDPKGVVGIQFKPLEDVYPELFQVHTDPDESFNAIRQLVTEMKERTHQLGERRVFEVDDLDPPLPHKLVIIDEPLELYSAHRRYESYVHRLVSAGRQAGFHIVVMTPYAHGEVIKTFYRLNFRLISSALPANARSVVGMDGVTNLGKYEFLYQENRIDAPIFFRTFEITPKHIEWAVSNVMFSARDAEEIGVYVFMRTNGDRGLRTILREGYHLCQTLVQAGKLEEIPHPWSAISVNNGNLEGYSSDAWKWSQEFMRHLELAGIAGEAEHGKSREVKARDLTDALRLWKVYRKQAG